MAPSVCNGVFYVILFFVYKFDDEEKFIFYNIECNLVTAIVLMQYTYMDSNSVAYKFFCTSFTVGVVNSVSQGKQYAEKNVYIVSERVSVVIQLVIKIKCSFSN